MILHFSKPLPNIDKKSNYYIVVFGAALDFYGSPSQALQKRLDAALKLDKLFYNSTLILSGRPEEVKSMEEYIRKENTTTPIIQSNDGINTYSTIREVTNILKKQKRKKTIIYISQQYHLFRIFLIDRLYHHKNSYFYPSINHPTTFKEEAKFVLRELLAIQKELFIFVVLQTLKTPSTLHENQREAS